MYKLHWRAPPWRKGNKDFSSFLSASRCSQNSHGNTYFPFTFPCRFHFCSFKSLILTTYWTINMLFKWAFKMNRADRNYKLCCQLLSFVSVLMGINSSLVPCDQLCLVRMPKKKAREASEELEIRDVAAQHCQLVIFLPWGHCRKTSSHSRCSCVGVVQSHELLSPHSAGRTGSGIGITFFTGYFRLEYHSQKL